MLYKTRARTLALVLAGSLETAYRLIALLVLITISDLSTYSVKH